MIDTLTDSVLSMASGPSSDGHEWLLLVVFIVGVLIAVAIQGGD